MDRDETAANAERVLLSYEHHKSMALRWSISLKSPVIDGMPRNDSVENNTERQITNHIDDQLYVKQCEVIINEIMPQTSRNPKWPDILRYTYLKPLATDLAVQERVGYEHSAFYEAKKDALCAFAELWPPYPSELVVRKA